MINKTTTKRYCKDFTKVENYDKAIADTTQTWVCHHRLETHNSDSERRLVDISHKELIALNMYYDRPPEELIFLTKAEHTSLHPSGMKGKHHSEEIKKKMSEANKGKRHSEESKKKMSEAKKGKPGHFQVEETRKKISVAKSEYNKTHGIVPPSQKGKRWFTNGEINVRTKECPEGFVPGRS